MSKGKKTQPVSTEPIAVVFGSERLASLWAKRNAFNPRRIILGTQDVDRIQGFRGKIITVRFPKDIWEPTSNPCAARMKEMESAIKLHADTGGEVIARLES